MSDLLLTLTDISKSFGAVTALKPLNLAIRAGEILGLIGENGAGKSTLIKLLSGVYQPDQGQLQWQGRGARFPSPRAAMDEGIATIHQELEYFGRLSVAENVLLGEKWPRTFWGAVRWSELFRMAQQRLDTFELSISPAQDFDSLTAAEKQEVMIASALARDVRLLILDEPTASLSAPEAERLFEKLRELRRRGIAMIYVSHRLDEILTITDRVAVMRDGKLVATAPTDSVTVQQLVEEMIGGEFSKTELRPASTAPGRVMLEVDEVTFGDYFKDVSFQVRAGEIVGLGGLLGAGRSELARAIYGLYPLDSGRMCFKGRSWCPQNASQSLQQGLVYLPEERKRQGLVLEHGVDQAISIGLSDLFVRFGLIPRLEEHRRVTRAIARHDIRTATTQQPIGTLSGGNQQKVLLARWLERDPEVLILDEPTRGVDVGAKAQIHSLMRNLADQGKAILLISSDLPELTSTSDRVLVMNRGKIQVELVNEKLNERNIILAASGISI